jgi:cellulose synthase/poly-beta-1,6-N-acetylglucosamine synthase-like glycosyltransferase
MHARYFKQRPSNVDTQEARMNFSAWVRQTHRWLAIVFTITVIANFAVRAVGEPPAWITYSPLPPLFLMLFSGLYTLTLPYVTKRTQP